MEVKRVLTKNNFMVQLEKKCKELELLVVKRFNIYFTLLEEKGLPDIIKSNGKLVPLENYQDKFFNIVANVPKFVYEKGTISGEDILEGLQFNLNIQHEIHHLFVNNPNFQTYSEVDEVFRTHGKFLHPW